MNRPPFLLFTALFFIASISFAKPSKTPALEKATFAGGCFWCMEPPFEKLAGVSEVLSGYTGGKTKNPTYKQVSYEDTGHIEAVEIHFNPNIIRYEDLLEVFWRNIDPTDPKGQFVDQGPSYTSAIFFHSPSQEKAARASLKQLQNSKRFKKEIVTPVKAAKPFYKAEDYHQDYYKKSPLKYKYYRYRSGRDSFLDQAWGKDRHYVPASKKDPLTFNKPSDAELQKKLTPLQYKVTQKEGTEKPFKNQYWDHNKQGIYVDIVSGEPLFSSTDKFKSGTGWPSFTQPLVPQNIVEKTDKKLFISRTEVRSKLADSHLGHVFKDGPKPTGLRYCINSASLRFVPIEHLEKEGLSEFYSLFK